MARKKSKGSERKAGKFGQAAKEGGQGGVSAHLNLPEGVKQFRPKRETYNLNVIGYIKTDKKDLEVGQNVQVGEMWPRKQYLLHYGLTEDDKPIVCPRSVGKTCKACQERKVQLANEEGDEELAEKLKPKSMELWNIEDLDDSPGEIQVFDFSKFKFGGLLEEEIAASKDEDDEYFYMLEDGRTVDVRFSKKTFKAPDGAMRDFTAATKINIKGRDEDVDEEWWEDNIVDLDNVLVIPSEERMDAFLSQTEYEDRDEEEDEKPKKSKRSRKKGKDEDEDEEDDEPKRSRRSKKKRDEEEEDEEPKKSKRSHKRDEDEDEEDEEPKRSRRSKKKRDEDDEDDDEPKRSRKSKKKRDEDEDEGDDEPKKSKRSKKSSSKKGGKNDCPAGGEFGIDNEQLDECDTCRLWTKCRSAKEEKEEDND